jgi:zinc protease
VPLVEFKLRAKKNVCYSTRMRWLCLIVLLLPCVSSGQISETVQTAKLQNGMKVLVQEDHSIPSVALYLFYKVGSRDEHPGITGISHFFEHMMFNGSRRFGPGEFDRQMEQRGGNNNAYTTKDVTVYTDWFPPDSLELMFEMEADRMSHLTFDQKLVESERGVVYSERRLRVDNDNAGALAEQVNATAIMAHPYHWPVVGWASDIEAWTAQDLETYYRQGYSPNNCTMVVVGDVRTANVQALAGKYFGSIPSHATFPEPRTKEPHQEGPRMVRIEKEAELPLLMFAFHMPETRNKRYPAIQVLESLMATGESSRLYSRLVDREQAALSVQVVDEPSLDPYLMTIVVQPRAGVPVERVEQLLNDELRAIQNGKPSDSELRKAKNQWLGAHYREMKTIAGRANMIGNYEVFYGDYKRLYQEPADIERVSAADVQREAASLFAENSKTVGILMPRSARAQQAQR